MAKKRNTQESGEDAAERFEKALQDDSLLRDKVSKHVDAIVDIAKKEGYSFDKQDMNKYLKRKHNPPAPLGSDTCFSEPPEM